jgi:hypothetical protein
MMPMAFPRNTAGDRGEQQGAHGVGLALPIERASEADRAGEGKRDPEHARHRRPHQLLVAREREAEDDDDERSEERHRVDDLLAAQLDAQVLPRDPPGVPENRHDAF